MKKNTLLFFFICFIVIGQGFAQPPQFAEPVENPFGLFSDGNPNTLTAVYVLHVDHNSIPDIFVADLLCLGQGCIETETRYFKSTNGLDYELQGVYSNTLPFGWPGIPNVDIDNDCDLDIIRNYYFGPEPDDANITNVVFYENTADTAEFDFSTSDAQLNPFGIELPGSPDSPTNPLGLVRPAFGDLDADGDLDFFSGGFWMDQTPNERFVYFKNIGLTPYEPQYDMYEYDPFGLELPIKKNHNSKLADMDCDGDLDLFTEVSSGQLFYHENIGTPEYPDFSSTPYQWPDDNFNPTYGTIIDFDWDGDLDVFSGGDTVRYYENTTQLGCEFELPCYIVGTSDFYLNANLSLYPNPATDQLSLELDSEEVLDQIEIAIFDLLGRRLQYEFIQLEGQMLHKNLQLKDFPKGIYSLKINSGRKFLARQFIKVE